MDTDLVDGIKWYLVFVISTVVHEAAHAWTAHKLGDDTARSQVTLDPTPHIRREPFGMVVVPLLSFFAGGWMLGWASAPYSPEWAHEYPRRSALMALAGPFSNLLLALLAVGLMALGLSCGFFQVPSVLSFTHMVDAGPAELSEFAGKFVSIFFSLNLLLAAFNLLPLPPLDGSNAPALLLPETAARGWLHFVGSPQIRFIGLFIAWKVFGSIFPAIHHTVAHWVFPQLH